MPLRRVEPFSAVLTSSPPLEVTDEQRNYIKSVLDICSSDSRFAEKAYVAIMRVLEGGSVTVPVITSLNPASAVLGSPSFTLHVMGTGFSLYSQIIFNGGEEPTTFVSDTEVTTGVNMDTAVVATDVPIQVISGEGAFSNTMTFSFTEAVTPLARSENQEEGNIRIPATKGRK